MTANSVIGSVDTIVKNSVPDADKLRWLLALDGRFFLEVMTQYGLEIDADNAWHNGVKLAAQAADNTQITVTGNEHMLIPYPFCDVYEAYLLTRIFLATSEVKRYINASSVYERMWSSLCSHISREYRHTGVA